MQADGLEPDAFVNLASFDKVQALVAQTHARDADPRPRHAGTRAIGAAHDRRQRGLSLPPVPPIEQLPRDEQHEGRRVAKALARCHRDPFGLRGAPELPERFDLARPTFERVGRQVQALGVPGGAQFTSASALVSYIIGVSVQNAVNGSRLEPNADRAAFLETVSAQWKELDAHEYPFTRHVAAQLREHDDLAEFLAGIDLILTGIAASL